MTTYVIMQSGLYLRPSKTGGTWHPTPKPLPWGGLPEFAKVTLPVVGERLAYRQPPKRHCTEYAIALVAATDHGECYHRPDCPCAKRGHLVERERTDLRSCKRCRPELLVPMAVAWAVPYRPTKTRKPGIQPWMLDHHGNDHAIAEPGSIQVGNVSSPPPSLGPASVGPLFGGS